MKHIKNKMIEYHYPANFPYLFLRAYPSPFGLYRIEHPVPNYIEFDRWLDEILWIAQSKIYDAKKTPD